MSCNPVAGFGRYSMENSAPVFGLHNWRKWLRWKQCCRCVMTTRPGTKWIFDRLQLLHGDYKKNLHWKEIFLFLYSVPVTKLPQGWWWSHKEKQLCKWQHKMSELHILLLTLSNLFFSVNRSTIILSTHPKSLGSVGDEFAVKDKWTEWRAIEDGLCLHCSVPWQEGCFCLAYIMIFCFCHVFFFVFSMCFLLLLMSIQYCYGCELKH